MANLTLELNINSASNLVNVNLISKMDVYAVITIHGDGSRKKQKVKTAVDRSGGSNPTWNHAVNFSVNERLARDGRLTLVMRLICRRVLGNKVAGGVNVPLLELLNSITPSINGDGNNGQGMKLMTYQVRTPSGKRSGTLTFSYRFKPDLPVIVNRSYIDTAAYSPSQIEHSPSAPPESRIDYPQLSQPPCQNESDHRKHRFAAGSSYDPLPLSYGPVLTEQPYFCSTPFDKSGHANNHAPHAPPSSQSSSAYYGPYGYAAPSPAGYGYGGTSYQQPREIGLGLEFGTGLLGGLMMGDIVSDVANCFDL